MRSEREVVAEAYASGRVRFMGIELLVTPGALVPRHETELLARTAVERLVDLAVPTPRVIDICCGAGNLACAIAHHVPGSRIWAADLTDACVDLTRRNVELCKVSGRVSVHQGDLFGAFEGLGLEGTIDAVVCNPPYISDKRLENENAHLLDLEPREAFSAGPYGLSIHMRVVRDVVPFLRPGGLLLLEVGLRQDRQVKILFDRTKAYQDVTVVRNDACEGRVVLGCKTS